MEHPSLMRFSSFEKKAANLTYRQISEEEVNRSIKLDKYSIYRFKTPRLSIMVDLDHQKVVNECILFLIPGQTISFEGDTILGEVLSFDRGFYCIEDDDHDVQCNGVLFNTLSISSQIEISESESFDLDELIEQLKFELSMQIPQQEILVAMLKILLIKCLRIHERNNVKPIDYNQQLPETLVEFRQIVEENYRSMHYPSDYADYMNLSLATLGRLTREYLKKTPTSIIQERIIEESKKELILTDKTIKLIAKELGFKDEYYFSRLFKKFTNLSPLHFREKGSS